MNMYDEVGTSRDLEREGIWLDFQSFRIKLAHEGGHNTDFAKAMKIAAKPYRRQIDNETLSDEVSARIYAEVYAKTIVKDWNILLVERDDDGKAILDENGGTIPVLDEKGEHQWHRGIHARDGGWIPFSTENVKQVLMELPHILELCRDTSSKFSNYRQSQLEGIVGN